jgi:starch-binding outer membrane protein, SusD/RagB family
MKKKILIIATFLSAIFFGSCVNDLDVTPKDPNTILSGNLNDDPAYMKQVLAKIYASFIIAGQGSNGGADISAPDNDFFTTTRALWNLQQLPTDEAMCAWGDVGIADLNTQTWSASNPFLTALYQRLGLSITYANDFIRFTNDKSDANVMRYNAEARFLRALAYYWYLDLFGNPPFTTDADGVGKFFPKQLDSDMAEGRKKLFAYLVSELKDLETKLPEAGSNYPQADQGAAWMLLSRLYLNAQVYTGTAKWDSVVYYTTKVEQSGKYSLATNYRQNFSADNHRPANPEMIFAFAQDGTHIQGYVGSTFIIQSSSDAVFLRSEEHHGLTSNTNWNGNRATRQFLHTMIDTLATYGNDKVPYATDPYFTASKDKRVFLRSKLSPDIPQATSSGDYGIGIYKFTAKDSKGNFNTAWNAAFANTDFPVFRFADALLMRAEANFRLGNAAAAVADFNRIRERAFGDTSANITAGDLNANMLLTERAREFYYEAQRRTDLVRFGQFTNGTLTWAWKGGVKAGVATPVHLNVYPIPADEVAANPYIRQNPGY